MLGLFRRHKTDNITGSVSYSFTLLTVSEQLKPIKQSTFEAVDQCLLEAPARLVSFDTSHWPQGRHYNLNLQSVSELQLSLTRLLHSASLPVVLTNSSETLLHSLPLLTSERKVIGIIHIGHRFELKASLEPEQRSVFHFALSRYSQCRLFCLGIDNTNIDERTLEYAEELGCDWITFAECSHSHRLQIRQQLVSYLSRCDDVIINLDLACLHPVSRLESGCVLDEQVVSRSIKKILNSGKVRQIQLVGRKGKFFSSNKTQVIFEQLTELMIASDEAA